MRLLIREKSYLKNKTLLGIILLFSLISTSSLLTNETLGKDCNKCHGMLNFSYLNSDLKSIRNLNVNEEQFKKSVHGNLNCVDCHKNTESYPHKSLEQKVGCNQDCHSNDKEGNPYTHEKQVTEFEDSIHTKGKNGKSADSPTCVSCHGYTSVHNIQKATKTITQIEKISQCIVCHDNKEMMIRNKVEEDAVESYRQSFHYKAVKFGGVSSATCQDCHGVHKIHPKDHKESSISDEKVADTCGNSGCHEGAKLNFAMSGANHLKLRVDKEPILYWEEKMFQILTGGTMAMLVVGIILDVQKRFGWLVVVQKLFGLIGKGFGFIFKALKVTLRFLKTLLFE